MEDEKDTLALIGVALAFIMAGGVPAVLGAVFPSVQAFLMQWGVLVPARASIFEIPGTGMGPSTMALLVLLGLVCLAGVLGSKVKRRKGDERR